MTCVSSFVAELRERGMRMTPQREMVLAALHDLSDHESAEEIFRRVQLRSTAVDMSTVYRTLELLQELKMLAVVETADGQRRYALTGQHGQHLHLVCRHCGRQIEADLRPVSALADELRRCYGFTLDLTRLSLVGTCASCSGDAGGQNR